MLTPEPSAVSTEVRPQSSEPPPWTPSSEHTAPLTSEAAAPPYVRSMVITVTTRCQGKEIMQMVMGGVALSTASGAHGSAARDVGAARG